MSPVLSQHYNGPNLLYQGEWHKERQKKKKKNRLFKALESSDPDKKGRMIR